ncbi:MAG TPA: phosphoribosylanthranilate isomerase [Polyangiaceae bacterium]|nr:phosphoribosylanthranilate isomerase [Polyangiaceae bacterium]
MRPRVKVCGVTRREDALLAAALGADALGFVFWRPSKRYLEPAAARAIVEALPPFVTPVGLFVDEAPEAIEAAARASGVRALQLHGREAPAACRGLSRPVLKAVAVDGPAALERADDYDVWGLVLDAPFGGGSGRGFDWTLVERRRPRAPFLVAGGLTPDNVGEAIARLSPHGVDVASGVESAPGVKDPRKLERFFEAVGLAAAPPRAPQPQERA